jgi:hypothetical protein
VVPGRVSHSLRCEESWGRFQFAGGVPIFRESISGAFPAAIGCWERPHFLSVGFRGAFPVAGGCWERPHFLSVGFRGAFPVAGGCWERPHLLSVRFRGAFPVAVAAGSVPIFCQSISGGHFHGLRPLETSPIFASRFPVGSVCVSEWHGYGGRLGNGVRKRKASVFLIGLEWETAI